jgi:hypothetical protein
MSGKYAISCLGGSDEGVVNFILAVPVVTVRAAAGIDARVTVLGFVLLVRTSG